MTPSGVSVGVGVGGSVASGVTMRSKLRLADWPNGDRAVTCGRYRRGVDGAVPLIVADDESPSARSMLSALPENQL